MTDGKLQKQSFWAKHTNEALKVEGYSLVVKVSCIDEAKKDIPYRGRYALQSEYTKALEIWIQKYLGTVKCFGDKK